MFKIFTVAIFVAFLNTGCSAQPMGVLQKVVIIRHAEKPLNGDNLSCKGLNRSLALPGVLYKKFNLPNKIFVPVINNGKAATQVRMFETIAPFAIKYNLSINTKFDADDVKDLAGEVLKEKGYVLIVWSHSEIDKIAKALGVENKKLKWDDSDFDSIWIIDFQNGKPTLSFDKENINPPDSCGF